jgi:hypothetical protein
MNVPFLYFPVCRITTWVSASMLTLGIVGCGGGGGDSDKGDATIRPKTMDGIVLNLDNSAQFEFIRNQASQGAVNNGGVETGSFIYTPLVAADVLKIYDNLGGTRSNFRYPLSLSGPSYSYRAINDSSGVLTLTAAGNFSSSFTAGENPVINDSWIRLFYSYSPIVFTPNTRVAEIGITFTDRGSFVTSDTITVRLPESPLVSTLDSVRIPSSISLATLGPVPLNYNPTIDAQRPSRVVPASLTNRDLVATNGIPDPTKDFVIKLVSNATVLDPSANSEEIGQGLLFVYDTARVPPGLSAVSLACDYTWRRVGGTDSGNLILSNIPSTSALPFAVSLNGALILNFTGTTTGTYSGVVDGDTPSASDVTGTFIIR